MPRHGDGAGTGALVKLIEVLAAGVQGAEGGTVHLYRRGTTTHATLYADFEAKLAQLANPVTLDQHGAATVYVNEVVDAYVYMSSGALLKPKFTIGGSAAAEELISSLFSGTDYDTGLSAAGKPLLVKTALEQLKTSITSVSSTISSLASGPFFDVTDPDYGAVGDGVTDDSGAFALADAAATAAGGGILWCPAGVYYIEASQIELSEGVSLLGAGPGLSRILASVAIDAPIITPTATAGKKTFISGIKVDFDGTLSESCIYWAPGSTGASLLVDNCILNAYGYAGYGIYAADQTETHYDAVLEARNCIFQGGTKTCIDTNRDSRSVRLVAIGNRFRKTGDLDAPDINMAGGIVVGNIFENTGVTTGAADGNVEVGADDSMSTIVGNLFTAPDNAITVNAIYGATSSVVESGNSISEYQGVVLHVGDETTSRQDLGERGTYYTVAKSATTVVETQRWGTVHITSDGVDFEAALNAGPVGSSFTLAVQNTHASTAVTLTFSGVWENAAYYYIAAGHAMIFNFKSFLFDGSHGWALVNDGPNDLTLP